MHCQMSTTLLNAIVQSSLLLLLLILPGPVLSQKYPGFRGIPGQYCSIRSPTCCPSRDDECTMDILDAVCYCDMFCDRPDGGDCCPDFYGTCTAKPVDHTRGKCSNNGVRYNDGDTIFMNCRKCTCQHDQWICDGTPCLVEEEYIDRVNQGHNTWRASNYTEFWGRALDDGIIYRLGTLYPERSVQNMHEIAFVKYPSIPPEFDARQKWPAWVHPVRNQHDCGASWAFSTTATSADRLAILSEGKLNVDLSVQQVLSCNHKSQQGCKGGYLDRAWWYIRKYGVVSDRCYPYTSGNNHDTGNCYTPKEDYRSNSVKCPSPGANNKIYKMTPPYRIAKVERDIQAEILENGPVQATFLVHEDFFIYKSGVYQHLDLAASKGSQYQKSAYHSVRLIGWGEEYQGGRSVKYWLAANSWGPQWGENGFFKILRGENHCQIESFILGAWGKGSKKRRRRFQLTKLRKLARQ